MEQGKARATRRTHTKSKKGCKNCKLRRVKCDEVQPTCGFCAKRGFDCEYLPPSTRGSHSSSDSSSSGSEGHGHGNPQIALVPAAKRRLEMRLIHHYTSVTCRHMGDANDGTKEIYMIYLPQMAFDCDTLLKALLAVAAAHLAVVSPADEGLFEQSAAYFADALARHRAAIQSLEESVLSYEEIYATTLLVSFKSAVNALVDVPPSEVYNNVLLWFSMAQGVTSMSRNMWPRMAGTGLRARIESHPQSNIGMAAMLAYLTSREPVHFQYLLAASPELEGGAGVDQALKLSVQLLEYVYAAVTAELSMRERVKRWQLVPMLASPVFMQLLQDGAPVAMAWLAHYLALTEFIDDTWWLIPGAARVNVEGLATLVPVEWAWAFSWPLQVVNSGA